MREHLIGLEANSGSTTSSEQPGCAVTSWTVSALSYICCHPLQCISTSARGLFWEFPKVIITGTVRFTQWADPILGPLGTSLFIMSLYTCTMRDTTVSMLACSDHEKYLSDGFSSVLDGIKFGAVGIFALILLIEAIGVFSPRYYGYHVGRLKSTLLGTTLGALFSHTIWKFKDPYNCTPMLTSNVLAGLALGIFRFYMYSHDAIAIRKQGYALSQPFLMNNLKEASQQPALLRSIFSVIMTGMTAIIIKDIITIEFNQTVPNDFNIPGLLVFLAGAAVGLTTTLLSTGKHSNAAHRTDQARMAITNSVLDKRALGIFPDLFFGVFAVDVPWLNAAFWAVSLFCGLNESLRKIKLADVCQGDLTPSASSRPSAAAAPDSFFNNQQNYMSVDVDIPDATQTNNSPTSPTSPDAKGSPTSDGSPTSSGSSSGSSPIKISPPNSNNGSPPKSDFSQGASPHTLCNERRQSRLMLPLDAGQHALPPVVPGTAPGMNNSP